MLNKLKIAVLLLLAWLALAGCARTVTDKTITDNFGQTVTTFRDVEFTFNFAGAPVLSNYDYYLIFSTQNITLRAHPEYASLAANPYFASPDDTRLSNPDSRLLYDYGDVNEAELRDVFGDFFGRWSQYYVYNNLGQARAYRGPFVSGNILTPENARATIVVNGNTIKWTMSLPMNDFYFALVTVYNGAGSEYRLFMDSIGDNQPFGINSQRQLLDRGDEAMIWENAVISGYPGLNVSSYGVRILEY